MKIGLIAGVLLSAAMPLLTSGNELEQNVIKYMPKSMQPNLPGKFKADEIILKRRGHVEALKKFAPYILDEYSAIDKAMKWPADTYLNIQVFGVKKNEEKAPHECTSWIVMPDLTASRTLILHKNRDSSAKRLIAQQRAVKGKYSWIGMGNLGGSGTNMGMNEKALTVAMNSGDRTRENSEIGLDTVILCRIMLENCATAREAADMLVDMIKEKAYRHGKAGSIWFIADAESAFVAENNAQHIAVKPVFSGMLIRANSWDFPEMIPYSIAKPNDIVGNNRREYAVRDYFFNQNDAVNKGVSPEMVAAASRIRSFPEDAKCYPLCGKLTNSAATFVIDQEFPQLLSYAVFAFGPPNHTLYLPVPLVVERFPEELLNGSNPDAAFVRFNGKKAWKSDADVLAVEQKLNLRHRKALSAARRVMRTRNDVKAVRELLNTAFKENCAVFLKDTANQ